VATNDVAEGVARRSIGRQVTATHAGGLYRDDHLAGGRLGVWEVSEFDFLLAEEDYAAHLEPPLAEFIVHSS
jgi:hypothetical protein